MHSTTLTSERKRHDPWQTHRLEIGDDADALLEREWLLTNGTGAFAAGTAAGCPTRRYHGLFIAATAPPVGRRVMLNHVWEQLILHKPGNGATQSLAFNTLMFHDDRGQRIFAPTGIELLRTFTRGLSVQWHYAWGEIEFERELILHWKQQAATLRYRVRGLEAAGSEAELRLHPMLTMRDFHALRGAEARIDFKPDGHVLRAYHEGHALTMRVASDEAPEPARFEADPHWWRAVRYPLERERGQEDMEDYFVPGALAAALPRREVCELTLSVALGPEPVDPIEPPTGRREHLEPIAEAIAADPGAKPKRKGKAGARRKSRTEPTHDRTACALALAADDFLVTRRIDGEALATIIAGYPWFADWGRDTFIALPGLLLETQRYDEAERVLRAFAINVRNGLVPNRFDDYQNQAAHYNTVDASLWFIHAALEYLHHTRDRDAWRNWLGPACVKIVAAYRDGTDYDIRCEDDGLVTAGSPRTQLTWMDAAVGERVFTPRPGKAVEVNALWHHALCGLAEMLEDQPLRESPSEAAADLLEPATLTEFAQRVRRSFNRVFWSEDHGHLFDHVWRDPDQAEGAPQPDATCRPNQIFAVALPHSPLAQAKQRRVLAAVRDRLLTPVGLRTLPRDDPNYHPHYRGDRMQRDEAYHQGPVWAWLIGPYAEAVLRLGRFSDKAKREAADAIAPLLEALLNEDAHAPGSIGQLHEIYDAEPDEQGRHRPVGTFAQAWSVAEVLRIWRLTRR